MPSPKVLAVEGDRVVVSQVEQPISLRPMVDTDRAFVFQTWLKDFSRAPLPRQMDPRIYNLEQKRVIDRLMSSSAVVIACDQEERDNILGWACGETWDGVYAGAVVHYVYVPRHFRQRRIGRRLLEHLVGVEALEGKVSLFYSHLPEPRHVEGRMLPNVALLMAKAPQYNPFMAFR